MRVVGLISVYKPISSYCENIKKASQMVDLLIVMDDSETCQRHVVERVLSENVAYYWNGSNIGLCKSINNGIRKAIENRADWIFIMDQDTCPEGDVIAVYKELIGTRPTSDIALLAPQYDYDRHPRSARDGYKYLKFANLSGCMISVEKINRIGLYDERFFIDGMDREWCIRARNKGFSLLECSKAVVHHNPAETKQFKILGKTIFKYGYSTCKRHYYQIKSGLLINSISHDRANLVMLFAKIFKALFLYGNHKEYLHITACAFRDFRNEEYGK